MRLSIANRFAIIFSLLVLFATATAGYMVYREARRALITAATDRLIHTAEIVEVRFTSSIEAIGKDVRFLAKTPPVEGIVRARLSGNRPRLLDPQTAISDDEWRDQLASLFGEFLENRPSYRSIRLVEIANQGRELVRVNSSDSGIYRAPRSQLQAIAEERVYREAILLPQGTIYVSEITLDRAGGVVLEPNIPITQVALPVYSSAGKVVGLLQIDVDLRELFASLKELALPFKDLYIANEQGDFLIHPDPKRTFGSERGQAFQLLQMFPKVEALFNGEEAILMVEDIQLDTETMLSAYFERMRFNRGVETNAMVLGITSPHSLILADVNKVRDQSIMITLIFSLCGIVFALIFSGVLTRPLSRITQAISTFGAEDWKAELPTKRTDEIGVLARSFSEMARQIQDQVIELESKERRQRTIFETSPEGIIVTDGKTGTIESVNEATEKILGYTAAEMTGKRASTLILPVNGKVFPDVPEPWMALGAEDEVVGLKKEGQKVPLSITSSTFELAGEQKYTLFLKDVTERKANEAMREQLLHKLSQERSRLQRLSESLEERVRERTEDLGRTNKTLENRNRELQDFAYVASHDLQEPLRKIQAFSGLLTSEYKEKMKEDDEWTFYVQRIQYAAERMSKLITDLLAFSRITTQAKPYEMVDLSVIAHEVLTDLEIRVKDEGGVVHVGDLPTIEADATQMRQLLQNLIANGLKFHREGVAPIIKVRGKIVEEEANNPEGAFVHLEVEDNGIGFDEKYLERIFSPFQRLHGHSEYEGTGMGLSICRRIVERHEGTITAKSGVGQGATFIVVLPVRQPNALSSVTEIAV